MFMIIPFGMVVLLFAFMTFYPLDKLKYFLFPS